MLDQNTTIRLSPHGSFRVSLICKTLAICEADAGDRYGWGNAIDIEPAFIAYLGCSESEVEEKIHWINQTTGCYLCEVRKSKYLNTDKEIKIRGLQRWNDQDSYGLEYIAWAENGFDPLDEQAFSLKETIDSDEYDYYLGYQ